MPRRARGPRLYLDPRRRTWAIRDGGKFVRTGRAETDRGGAEEDLGAYLARKHKPERSGAPLIADMLLAYTKEHAPSRARPGNIAHAVGNLEKWWGDKRLADVTAKNCRAYAETRPQGAGRRDLETLRAAIGHWHREYGPLPALPSIVMPDRLPPRDRWLTREEARALRGAAMQTPHLYRFVVIGLATGSRAGAIFGLRWDMVDLVRGVMLRRPRGETESRTKRRPPVRLGQPILRLLRRWRKLDPEGVEYVCHYDGRRVTQLRRSWGQAVKRAGLTGKVTPHTLRHTRATWLMQEGVDPWQAAGALGMSLRVLESTYGHHSPEWQREASEV